MKWPWVSRRLYELCDQLLDEAHQRFQGMSDLAAKHERNNKTLQSVVATLREEVAASKLIIKDLNAGLEAAKQRKPVPKQPALGNFLKTRDALEAGSRQNLPIEEIDLDEHILKQQKEPVNGR